MRNPHNESLKSDRTEDRPARPERSEPERKCVLSGDHGPRGGLIRLAISPDGAVLPDVLAKAPGRGAWIGVNRTELEAAMAKGRLKAALARAFKGQALTISEDLPARIEQALLRCFTDRLGLEMRSGRLLVGSDRIGDQARMGRVAWLAHAADASLDGSRKLDQAWRVGKEQEGSGLAGMRLPLDRAALSVALGRDNVVHLALADHASAERVLNPLQRLLHFTGAATAANNDHGDRTAHTASRSAATMN